MASLPPRLEEYIERVRRVFGTEELGTEQTTFGYVMIKGNWHPPTLNRLPSLKIKSKSGVSERPTRLDLRGRVLHERALLITSGLVPVRSHEEVEDEVVANIGDVPVSYIHRKKDGMEGGYSKDIDPREEIRTISGVHGLFHGFQVMGGGIGVLYVAKALKPEFVEGDSFRVPENTYEGNSAS